MKVRDIIPFRELPILMRQFSDAEVNKGSIVVQASRDLPVHNHLFFKIFRETIVMHCDFPIDAVLVVLEMPA